MHKLGLGLVVLGSLAVNAQADNFHSIVTSSGALAMFDGTSTDGCLHVAGIFFTDSTPSGPVARVFAPVAEDTCEGTSGTLIGEAPAAVTTNGLGSSTASGTVVAWDFQAQIPDTTFEFSLAFTGTGPTIVDKSRGKSVSPGGNVIMSFSSSRRRAANVSGTMTVDGGSVSLSGAFIGAGISGELSVAH